ncbi:hypothetical protein GA0070610_1852 [Micromonospora echinofusca]|uniref:Uncharacterized protein n=1 Tax=Micromonospora echinofusca TaxID=47858 RepID=A0A1C5G9C2_MICEH|nr:hypothetical protein [Micromonospora echinofusca]SCG15616.1 hypothetical protein GA0070610_1852 [Micromonospora echinofusca]
MSSLSRADRITIAHVCQDWAPNYYNGPFNFSIDNTVRYLADGHLEALTDRHGRDTIWRAVAAHLAAHPHTLTAPRTTQALRDQRRAERDARAAAHLDAARDHHRRDLPYEALALIDRAELRSPSFDNFDRFRASVHRKFPPYPPTNLAGTELRYRHTLPLARPTAPVAFHGALEQQWVYPGRQVIVGPWPAPTPEQCTAVEQDGLWLDEETALVCPGCGLDMT